MQSLSVKDVVYRPFAENFLTLQLALAWRQNESSPTVYELLKVLENIGSIHDLGMKIK
jgi:hypothetical protein